MRNSRFWWCVLLAACSSACGKESVVRAVNFESRKVYHSAQTPGYTSWVSFFPGDRGQWYLTCEEVTKHEEPLPQCTHQQWFEMGLPIGYDKSQYRMEMVILESMNDMKTWNVISREPCRFHHTAGQFATARTKDGRFLRFVWSCYSLDPDVKPNEILFTSDDDGKTWKKESPFHNAHFVSYPHRLRTLRDGTLVLALPMSPRWGTGTEMPVRTCTNLNAIGGMQMTLWFSYDQGRTWDGPLPIYAGQSVSETDFVELSEGHLLCINNSIFANPGRQIIYRDGRKWTPGLFERAMGKTKPAGSSPGQVPETVCLTDDGILVGRLRAGHYSWSDDLGQTWQRLEGAPYTAEVYQPWIHTLPDGRIACAGHFGADDAIGKRDQYLCIQLFRLEVLRKTKDTTLLLDRDYDQDKRKWPNAYTITLLCNGEPLADNEIEFWYVMRNAPGYDSWNSILLEERMQMGGKLIKLRTDAAGKAHIALPDLDKTQDIHLSYQFIARFNVDRSDPSYKPAQTPEWEQYCNCRQDPPINDGKSASPEGG